MESHQPRRVYLITHPRTASNLLVRILALDDQPDVAQHRPGALGGYFFVAASRLELDLGLREKHIDDWSEDERGQMKEKFQECFDGMEEYVKSAETEGKIAFVKEHGYWLIEPSARMPSSRQGHEKDHWTMQIPSNYGTESTRSSLNKSIFPDEFLRTWLPTFLIRHPALVFPSQYRAMTDVNSIHPEKESTFQLDMVMTFRWIRSLYDYWADYLGKSAVDVGEENAWPIVIDADDVMAKPEVVLKYSKLVGLDPTKLKFEWEPTTSAGESVLSDFLERRLLSTLRGSSGIVLEKVSTNINIDTEAKKWRVEFGDKVGRHMEKAVRDAMPDYEYMKERRIRG